MLKFALKLFLFAFLFFLFDKLFIIVANLSAESEVDKRLEYLVKGELNKDIIIAGSSTGSRDIIAGQLEKATGLQAYNLCYPGSDIEFHDFILRTLVKFNEPPRIVLLVVDDDAELRFDETITYRKDRLYPLVKHPYIYKELANRGGSDKLFSRFLIINRLSKYNFDLRKKEFTHMDTIMNCGSMPISWKRKDFELDYLVDAETYPLEQELPEKIAALEGIIQTCESNNMKLIIVFPPIFQAHSISFENRIRELCGSGVYFYRYNTENPIYRDKAFYSDETHLIRKGSVIFTNELALYLNDLIGQKTINTISN